MDSSLATSSSSSSSASAAAAVDPGKSSSSSKIPAAAGGAPVGTSAVPPALLALVGLTVTDGAGYTFVLEADGSFLIIGAPPGKNGALNKRVRAGDANPKLAEAWKVLAAKMMAEHPQAAAAPAQPAAAEPAAAPVASSPLDMLLAGLGTVAEKVSGGLDAIGTFVGDLLAGLSDAIGGPMPVGGEAPGVKAPGTAAGGATAGGAVAGGAAGGAVAGGAGAEADAGAAPGAAPAPSVSTPGAAKGPIGPDKHQSRASFLRPGLPSSVTDHPTTSAILDSIWPYFDQGDQVIGAFLSPGQQAWKVNYHWELVLWVCDKAQSLTISDEHKAMYTAIAATLRGLAPNPASGYLDDSQMAIIDQTDQAACDARYAALKQAKKDLEQVIAASGASGKVTGPTADRFLLSWQYVKPAGQSKHGTGYAFDIKGDNARIAATGASLGMSGSDDEDYHVHVEFGGGVKAPATPAPTAP